MTAIDIAPVIDVTAASAVADAGQEAGGEEAALAGRDVAVTDGAAVPQLAFVPIGELQPHPRNVRQNLKITAEWVAGIRENGIDVPLKVCRLDDGTLQIVMGHRRYFGALEAGLAELPCVIVDAAAQKPGGAFTDMYRENVHRENLTSYEEAAALFNAAEEGMSRAAIRKVTGLSAGQVKAAVKAGGMSSETRDRLVRQHEELSLVDQAIYAEFDGDEAAITELLDRTRWSGTARLAYFAQVIRDRRAEEARAAAVRAELAEQGITVTSGLPRGAAPLSDLRQDGAELTVELHALCEGRAAYFARYGDPTVPIHYCSAPVKYGHQRPDPVAEAVVATEAGPVRTQTGAPAVEPKLVRQGNAAWRAAATVRADWLKGLLARKKAPAEVIRWVAEQIVTMPEPLCKALGGAHTMGSFTTLSGLTAATAAAACSTATAVRLPLVMLAPIATAYENQIAGDGDRVNTWRTDRWAVCTRASAGTWLAFLASLGYPLSPIEQAVADGRPYTGDDPAETGSEENDAAAGQDPGDDATDPGNQHGPGAEGDEQPGDSDEAMTHDAAADPVAA